MLRLIAFVFAVLGVAALSWDALAEGPFRMRDLGEWWFRLHPGSLQVLEPAIARHVSPFLWDPVMLTVLTTPAGPLLLGVAAALLLLRRAL